MKQGIAIAGTHIIDGWLKAAEIVSSPGFDADHVSICVGQEWAETPSRLRQLDDEARKLKTDRPSGVADVLCPSLVLRGGGTSAERIERGWAFLGRGRRTGIQFSGWRDTYFERLTGHRATPAGLVEGFKENRLLNIIEKINLWDHNIASSLYAHTDIPADSLRTRGSPCLQYVQFRVFDGDRVGVTGLYRSHDYLSKALGNMVGLQRLARFVAQQTGRKFGQVTVISLAPIAEGGKGKLRQYVNRVAELQGI